MFFSTIKQSEVIENKPYFNLSAVSSTSIFSNLLRKISQLQKTLYIIFFWFSLILIYRFFAPVFKAVLRTKLSINENSLI